MERFQKRWYLPFGYAVIGIVMSFSSKTQAANWPVIHPLHETRTFVNQRSNTDYPFLALIKDTAGIAVYKLDCHNGNYVGDSEMNFSGDFQCPLFALNGSNLASGNLLAASTPNEQSADWWNRGRLRSAQLRGDCLLYPEYSTERHFRLRGMRVTLRFTDIEWCARKDQQNNPLLKRFKFILDVVPDTDAHSLTAELPGGPEPPRSCYP
jgi:hypothetical protein